MASDFPYVEIPAQLAKLLGERTEETRVYVQTGDAALFSKWFDAICKEIGPTVSPGGACALAHVTRAGVHKRMKDGKLTAFWFYSNEPEMPYPWIVRLFQKRSMPFVYIPVTECKAWGMLVEAKYERLRLKAEAGQLTAADQEEGKAFNEEVGSGNAEEFNDDFVKVAVKKAKRGLK